MVASELVLVEIHCLFPEPYNSHFISYFHCFSNLFWNTLGALVELKHSFNSYDLSSVLLTNLINMSNVCIIIH